MGERETPHFRPLYTLNLGMPLAPREVLHTRSTRVLRSEETISSSMAARSMFQGVNLVWGVYEPAKISASFAKKKYATP